MLSPFIILLCSLLASILVFLLLIYQVVSFKVLIVGALALVVVFLKCNKMIGIVLLVLVAYCLIRTISLSAQVGTGYSVFSVAEIGYLEPIGRRLLLRRSASGKNYYLYDYSSDPYSVGQKLMIDVETIKKLSISRYSIKGDVRSVVSEPPCYQRWRVVWQNNIHAYIRMVFGLRYGNIFNAMVFGVSEDLSTTDSALFKKYGLAHILVASGANVIIIVRILELIIARWVSRTHKNIIVLAVLLFYLSACDLGSSMIRSALMLSFITFSLLFGRPQTLLMSLLICLNLIVLNNPYMIFDVGLQLSVAAILGMELIGRRLLTLTTSYWGITNNIIYSLLSIIFLSWSAQVMVLPLILYYFNTFAVSQVITSLLLTPVFEILTLIGLLAAVVGFIIPQLINIGWWVYTVPLHTVFSNMLQLSSTLPVPEQAPVNHLFLVIISYSILSVVVLLLTNPAKFFRRQG